MKNGSQDEYIFAYAKLTSKNTSEFRDTLIELNVACRRQVQKQLPLVSFLTADEWGLHKYKLPPMRADQGMVVFDKSKERILPTPGLVWLNCHVTRCVLHAAFAWVRRENGASGIRVKVLQLQCLRELKQEVEFMFTTESDDDSDIDTTISDDF
jgi:hypothetical protein